MPPKYKKLKTKKTEDFKVGVYATRKLVKGERKFPKLKKMPKVKLKKKKKLKTKY